MIQPYVQGSVGWNYYHTGTTFRDQDVEEIYDRIKEENGSSLAYAITGGLHIVPNYWYARVDVRLTYMLNTAVGMLTKTGFSTPGPPVEAFEFNISPAAWVFIHVGGTYMFD